jgi:hypothetical protein
MKTLNTIVLALGAAAVLAGNGLYAQQSAVAKIPFDFAVQTANMPAGEYTLARVSEASGVIRLQSLSTGHSVLALAPNGTSTDKGNPNEKGKLIFHRYGDRYFFAEVWMPNGGLCGAVKPSKLERELRASKEEKQMALVTIPMTGAGQ